MPGPHRYWRYLLMLLVFSYAFVLSGLVDFLGVLKSARRSEIAWREHQANAGELWLRRTRLPAGEHCCAGYHGESSAGDLHGWLWAAGNPCVILTASMVRKFFMVFVLFFSNL